MSRLYHVSDEPGIARFEPRQIGDGPQQVWAIDEAHLCNYLLPRDCPRVCLRANARSTPADVALLDGAASVVAIEAGWEARARTERLFVYEMPLETFELTDTTAGYWCSPISVEPLGCTEFADLPAELAARRARLIVLPSLWPLHDRVRTSSLDFSMIRMRNALPR